MVSNRKQNKYLSPSLKRVNCSEIIHANVGPTSERANGSSTIPPTYKSTSSGVLYNSPIRARTAGSETSVH